MPDNGGLSADCADKNLTRVPSNLPQNIIKLNLKNNRLGALLDDDLKSYSQLRSLDLSLNNLTKLGPNSLASTILLEELYLNSNSLQTTNESMPYNVFDKLKALSVLKIDDNQRIRSADAATIYRDDLFLELSNLQTLALDGIRNAEFGEGFSKLRKLSKLEIYGNIESVSNKTFKRFSGLPITHLNIKSGSNLVSLEPESFVHFQKLTLLDLGYNQGLDLSKVSNAWYGLRNTSIKTLIVSRVIADEIPMTNMPKSFYRHLSETKLERLDLDRNNILEIAPGLAENLKHLIHLDMSYNRIGDVQSYALMWPIMRRLKFLDSSHQVKRYFRQKREIPQLTQKHSINVPMMQPMMLMKNRSSRARRLSLNAIYSSSLHMQLTKNGVGRARRSSLNVHVAPCLNRPTSIKPCSFPKRCGINPTCGITYSLSSGEVMCFFIPPKLEFLNMTASLNEDLKYFPQIVGLGGNHMQEFIYRENGLKFFTGPFVIGYPNPKVPLTIDVSDNGLTCVSPDILMWTIKRGGRIDKMAFSNNNLYEQLEHDLTGDLFKHYKLMTNLQLDRNGIKSLPWLIFQNLSSMEILNLSGNSLRLIEFKISHMKQLKVLDIGNNLITNIDANSLFTLDQSMATSNMSLNLYGNPLQCSCDTLPFLHWMQKNRKSLIGFDTYFCIYNNKESVTFDKLELTILMELSARCSSRVALWVSFGLVLIAIIAVFLSVLAFRHRWDFRFFILHLRTGGKELINDMETKRRYKYDAFVIHHHHDILWVRHELETKLGFYREDNGDDVDSGELVHTREIVANGVEMDNHGECLENEVELIHSRECLELIPTAEYLENGMELADRRENHENKAELVHHEEHVENVEELVLTEEYLENRVKLVHRRENHDTIVELIYHEKHMKMGEELVHRRENHENRMELVNHEEHIENGEPLVNNREYLENRVDLVHHEEHVENGVELVHHEEYLENQNSLIQSQETTKRFRFCIHQRDFLAGGNINEEILDAIENSRKMVLVMSVPFLQSNWCNYELQMAITENVHRGFNTIIPIMLEPLENIKDMSTSIRHIVRDKTYLEWPAADNEEDRAQFWVQLRKALATHRTNSMGCESETKI